MLLKSRFLRLAVLAVAWTIASMPKSASALWIVIEVKQVKTGSWSLFGSTFNHYSSRLCFSAGPGDLPAQYQGLGITFDPLYNPDDVCLTDLRLLPGPGALAELGGDPLIFDDTMFPAPPGFAFDTQGGTEFNIHFDTPRPTIDGPPMIDLPGVFVSSRLPLGDPNLIRGEARLIGGQTFPVKLTSVPEPGSVFLGSSAAVILGAAATRRRRRRRQAAPSPARLSTCPTDRVHTVHAE